MSANTKTLAQKLQSVDRRILYGILILVTSVSLFFPRELPNKPNSEAMDLYAALLTTPTDRTVFVESDWTLSTRGENSGHMENLMRILMERNIKFALYSWGDPQAPQVARDVIRRINAERVAQGRKPYRQWEDWVSLGLVTDLESFANTLRTDLRGAIRGKKDRDTDGVLRDVFESPVMSRVNSIKDVAMIVNVTANSSGDVLVQRLSGRVPLYSMCTGVVGPQLLPYHQAGQMQGVAIGLKGVYDGEYIMHYGLNYPSFAEAKVKYQKDRNLVIEPFREVTTFDRGRNYYLTLHVALLLMILAIVLGNVGVAMGRRKGGR